MFELVKNSLRAVQDRFNDSDSEPPAIQVVVAEGLEDVTIKVRTCTRLQWPGAAGRRGRLLGVPTVADLRMYPTNRGASIPNPLKIV